MTPATLPVLYTFRRCPYAMRARWALRVAGVPVTMHEVALRDKPAAMLAASPKGTVPVLVLPDRAVIDESLDIMLWALHQHDPQGWLRPERGTLDEMRALIEACEHEFKPALDRYKYATRFRGEWAVKAAGVADGTATAADAGVAQEAAAQQAYADRHFAAACAFLHRLAGRLLDEGEHVGAMSGQGGAFLFGARPALADAALAPFVRQFVRHDEARARAALPAGLWRWLDAMLALPSFAQVMAKPGPATAPATGHERG